MKHTYLAVVHDTGDKNWRYIAEFPDFNGAATEENTIDGIERMAEDLLLELEKNAMQNGTPLPEPTLDPGDLLKKADAELRGGAFFIMPITVYPSEKVVRISMTGPDDKLECIKDFAHKSGTTRSAFMIESAMKAIAEA